MFIAFTANGDCKNVNNSVNTLNPANMSIVTPASNFSSSVNISSTNNGDNVKLLNIYKPKFDYKSSSPVKCNKKRNTNKFMQA